MISTGRINTERERWGQGERKRRVEEIKRLKQECEQEAGQLCNQWLILNTLPHLRSVFLETLKGDYSI